MDGLPPSHERIPEIDVLAERMKPEPHKPSNGELQGVIAGLGLDANNPEAQQKARDFFTTPEYQLARHELTEVLASTSAMQSEAMLEEFRSRSSYHGSRHDQRREREYTRSADQRLQSLLLHTVYSRPLTEAVREWVEDLPPRFHPKTLPNELQWLVSRYGRGSDTYQSRRFSDPTSTNITPLGLAQEITRTPGAPKKQLMAAVPYIYLADSFTHVSEITQFSDERLEEHFEQISYRLFTSFFSVPSKDSPELGNGANELQRNWPWLNQVLNTYVGYLSRLRSRNVAMTFVHAANTVLERSFPSEAKYIPRLQTKNGVLTVTGHETPETLAAGLDAFQAGTKLAEVRQRERDHDRLLDELDSRRDAFRKRVRDTYLEGDWDPSTKNYTGLRPRLEHATVALEQKLFIQQIQNNLAKQRRIDTAHERTREKIAIVDDLIAKQERHMHELETTSQQQLDREEALLLELQQTLAEQKKTSLFTSEGREKRRRLQARADMLRNVRQQLFDAIQEQTTREFLPENQRAALEFDLKTYRKERQELEVDYISQVAELSKLQEDLQALCTAWDKDKRFRKLKAQDLVYTARNEMSR